MFKRDIGDMKESLRAQLRRRLPVVLSVAETQRLLGHFEGTMSLIIRFLYGGGLRVIESARLRIQDIDVVKDFRNPIVSPLDRPGERGGSSAAVNSSQGKPVEGSAD